MAKMGSKGTHVYIGTGTPPVPTAVTSITNAVPPVVTMASLPSGFVDGDMVKIDGTGEPLLDGKSFAAGSVGTPAGSFTLTGSDLTDVGATITSGTAQIFESTGANASMVGACPANISVDQQEPESIDLDDLCDTATVLGETKPPTISFDGWVNSENEGFKAIICASLQSPRQKVALLIEYPDGSFIFGPAEIGAVSVTAGVGAGVGFSGSGTFTEMPTYSWC